MNDLKEAIKNKLRKEAMLGAAAKIAPAAVKKAGQTYMHAAAPTASRISAGMKGNALQGARTGLGARQNMLTKARQWMTANPGKSAAIAGGLGLGAGYALS